MNFGLTNAHTDDEMSVADRLKRWSGEESDQELLTQSPKSVLIVEDDTTSVFLMKLALNKAGSFAAFDWVSNAKEALAHIKARSQNGRRRPYDLIIIDIFLEGKETGIELWERLSRQDLHMFPVLLTSSISEGRFSQLVGSQRLAPRYLRKPFLVDACAKTITDLLNQPAWQ